jgi:hypothetical protein
MPAATFSVNKLGVVWSTLTFPRCSSRDITQVVAMTWSEVTTRHHFKDQLVNTVKKIIAVYFESLKTLIHSLCGQGATQLNVNACDSKLPNCFCNLRCEQALVVCVVVFSYSIKQTACHNPCCLHTAVFATLQRNQLLMPSFWVERRRNYRGIDLVLCIGRFTKIIEFWYAFEGSLRGGTVWRPPKSLMRCGCKSWRSPGARKLTPDIELFIIIIYLLQLGLHPVAVVLTLHNYNKKHTISTTKNIQ